MLNNDLWISVILDQDVKVPALQRVFREIVPDNVEASGAPQ